MANSLSTQRNRDDQTAATPSRRASVTLDVHIDPWLRDVLFAAGALLSCVEAETSLVSDEIKEQAAEMRTVIERRTSWSFWTWKRGFTVWVAGRMFPLGWKDGRFVWRPRKVAMPR